MLGGHESTCILAGMDAGLGRAQRILRYKLVTATCPFTKLDLVREASCTAEHHMWSVVELEAMTPRARCESVVVNHFVSRYVRVFPVTCR